MNYEEVMFKLEVAKKLEQVLDSVNKGITEADSEGTNSKLYALAKDVAGDLYGLREFVIKTTKANIF